MKLRSLVACAALLASGANVSAWAQASTASLLDAAASACLAANNDRSNAPQDDLAACESALAQVDAIHAAIAAATPHDVNLHHMYRAFTQTAMAGAYAQIDKVRSTRVCTMTEASWAELSQLVDANSPAGFVEGFIVMREAAVRAITKCREEKGTPAGAPPLP